MSNEFFPEVWRLWDDVEKYGTGKRGHRRQWRTRLASQVHTHSEHLILVFHSNNDYANAPQCYFICTLLVCLYDDVCLTSSKSRKSL
jgi:hypothetical protein